MAAADKARPTFLRTVKAIAWSFVGLRGRAGHEQDTQHIQPLHLVAGGLIGVFLFVGALAALVNWIVPG